MRKLLAALFIAVGVQASLVLAGRHIAKHTQFPHQAMLSVKSVSGGWHRHCAGALISKEWVVTSAACVSDISAVYVHLGPFYLPTETEDSYTHHSIAVSMIRSELFDLALVRLSYVPEKNNGYVVPIRLPPKSYTTASYFLWKTTVSEYAVRNNGNESQVTIVYSSARVEPSFLCKMQYESFSDDNICLLSLRSAPKAEACTRDAGSPLIVKESDGKASLLGIATAFNGTASSCGTVFTKIAPHLDWISANTGIELRK